MSKNYRDMNACEKDMKYIEIRRANGTVEDMSTEGYDLTLLYTHAIEKYPHVEISKDGSTLCIWEVWP